MRLTVSPYRSLPAAAGLTVSLPLALAAPALAQADLSNFDSYTEGTNALVFTDGPTTFRDLDRRIPGSPGFAPFVIEDASADLAPYPEFSSPNLLGFGGYSPGPHGSFGRIGSFRIIPGSSATQAQVSVFEFGSYAGNTISLAGYRAGQEITRTTITIPGGFQVHHNRLIILALGGLDEIRLLGEGPQDQGVFFGAIDSVVISHDAPDCYTNCDNSTAPPLLNVADFTCFLQKFAAQDPYANCDGSATPPVHNVADFTCFLQKFAAGCP